MVNPKQPEHVTLECEPLPADILENLPVTVVILTPEGRVQNINRAPLETSQIRREAVVGKLFAETFWWSYSCEAQQQVCAVIERARRGETVCFETRIRSRPGVYLDRAATITPCFDSEQHIQYLIYTSANITELKRTEQTLRASEEHLRALAEMVPQLVWETRADGYVEYWNQRLADYLLASPEELRGYGWRQFIHPADRDSVIAIRSHSLETGEPYEAEYRFRNGRTGEYRWFLARGAPVRDETGRIVKWVGSSTDIDDQKRVEEVLRQSQEFVQALMSSTIMGVVILDGETLIEANDAFLRMAGYTREDVWGGTLRLTALLSPEYAPINQRAFQELAASRQIAPYETACVCKDGSRLPILVGSVALPHHPHRAISFMLDNSARKELEQRKDDFISMASHELKTPLTSLKLQMQLLKRKLVRQDFLDATPTLTRMEEQAQRLERLVEELLDVSRIQAGRLEYMGEVVDLDALLREVVETMQQVSAKHRIVMYGASHALLVGDRDRLIQVFTNLLSNAIKYSPDSNDVELGISSAGNAAIVAVRDYGIGIPREQSEKIFERFYRVVAPDQQTFPGLGMGLYVVSEIVKHHGGTITVESEPGKGSTFRVTLPVKAGLTTSQKI
jgi:PAS domain S-box-containing protein